MTDPLRDTPAFREAVEAGARAGFAKFNPGASFDDLPPLARRGWKREVEAPILAALPTLRRGLAEELRTEAMAMDFLNRPMLAHAYRDAADHLTRKEVL